MKEALKFFIDTKKVPLLHSAYKAGHMRRVLPKPQRLFAVHALPTPISLICAECYFRFLDFLEVLFTYQPGLQVLAGAPALVRSSPGTTR